MLPMAHTNTAELFNAMIKRAIIGVWHWFSIKHTDGYLHELRFRWNCRKVHIDNRLAQVFATGATRLRWKELVGVKPKILEGWIVTGWQGRLVPSKSVASRFNQWAGAQRFLWNRLLEREQAEYAATGKFLWAKQLQPIAVGHEAPARAGVAGRSARACRARYRLLRAAGRYAGGV